MVDAALVVLVEQLALACRARGSARGDVASPEKVYASVNTVRGEAGWRRGGAGRARRGGPAIERGIHDNVGRTVRGQQRALILRAACATLTPYYTGASWVAYGRPGKSGKALGQGEKGLQARCGLARFE